MNRTLGIVALALALAACAGTTPAPVAPAPVASPPGHAAPPAQDFWFAMYAADGLLVGINDGPVHATLRLRGSDLRTKPDDPHFYLVDGQLVQIAVASAEDFGGGAQGAALLEAHMAWESRYVESLLHAPIAPRRLAPCAAVANRPCLVWAYDKPPVTEIPVEQRVTSNLYATTIVAGQVLLVSSPVFPRDTEAQVAGRLMAVLASVEARPTPIVPDDEARRLRGGP